MIYTITLNPSIDRTMTIERFGVGGTFKAASSDVLPAGKGINAARTVATLGGSVTALGLVGETDLPLFAGMLAQAGIENRLSSVPGATRTCVTILDPVNRTETHLREQGLIPPADALARVEVGLADLRAEDWVVLAGSLPPGIPEDAYGSLIELIAGRGAFALLDANGPALLAGVEARPTTLKLNVYELWQLDSRRAESATEQDMGDVPLEEVLAAARRVQRRGIPAIVVSMGERGVMGLHDDGQVAWARVRLDQPVVDAVGSGDALGGGWVLARARGDAFRDALRLGVACGAANTLTAGAGRLLRTDVERLLARVEISTGS